MGTTKQLSSIDKSSGCVFSASDSATTASRGAPFASVMGGKEETKGEARRWYITSTGNEDQILISEVWEIDKGILSCFVPT
jgi:hypothetical protein